MLIDRPLKTFAGLLLLWFVIYALFRDFPSLDIAFSELFFQEAACPPDSNAVYCGLFPLGEIKALSLFRQFLFFLPADVLIFMLAWSIDVFFSREKSRIHSARQHNARLLMATWFIDVVLIVNVWFKEHSARPRPWMTDFFGGTHEFKPVADFTGTCVDNCSFISGEAASAGWLICVLALLPPRWRRWLTIPVVILAVATVFLRIAFGRHYLSDALLGFVSAPVVFMFLILIFGWKKMDSKVG